MRVLVIISNPVAFNQLNTEMEWANIIHSLHNEIKSNRVTVDRLSKPTLEALQQQLRKRSYHVIHFIGHGRFDHESFQGQLLLEDEVGIISPVNGSHIGVLLNDKNTVRLVILNSCESGKTSSEDSFVGVAQKLIEQGVPAVIAMQKKISDRAAICFSKEFYSSIVDGYPVEFAITEGRKAIYNDQPNSLEWAIPALYLHSDDGYLFDFGVLNRVNRIYKASIFLLISILMLIILIFTSLGSSMIAWSEYIFLLREQHITGIIIDKDGKTVSGVKVYLPQYKNNSVLSDEQGYFDISTKAKKEEKVTVAIEKNGVTERYDSISLGSEFNIPFNR